jgi:hypothetical protein
VDRTFHTFAICAYGESPYLEQCVRSLELETVKSEIICCTSTPNDHIRGIMEQHGIPLYVREGEPDIGEDWRFAWKMAGGRLVTLAHQDDIYRKTYTEELLRAYGHYPDLLVFASDYITIRMENGKAVDDTLNAVWFVKKVLRTPLRLRVFSNLRALKKSGVILGNAICCPTCTYNKEKIGADIFRSDLKFALDWENLWELAGREGRFVICEKPLLAYRVHGEAATSRLTGNGGREKDEETMFRKMLPGAAVEPVMKFYRLARKEYDEDN